MTVIITILQGGTQKLAHFVMYALTSSNIDRFSNLFHHLKQEKICNNTVTNCLPHFKCVATLPCEMSVS